MPARPLRTGCHIEPVRARAPAGPRLPRVELFFASLLVIAGLIITWFAVFVVYRLFKGQA